MNPADLLRSFDGPLTRELVRAPRRFGLGQVPLKRAPDALLPTVCGFCSTGCGLVAHMKDGRAVNVTPDPRYPVNRGVACPKGWEALTPTDATDRGTVPLLRGPDGAMHPATWQEAIGRFVEVFGGLRDVHGPESAAFLSTGQIPTEEMAFLGALFKMGLGFWDADSNTRQCMATAHVAYKQALGFDAPPFSYEDFEESDVLVFVGANPCIAHPILWERVIRNKRNPEILVLDPRRTETAEAATRHFPIAPKSDLVLLYAVAREVIARGWTDPVFLAEHVEGFDAFQAFVQEFTPEVAQRESGLCAEEFEALVRAFRPGRRVSVWFTMGVNQSHQAVRTAQAIVNLCLVTGNIGKAGTGPNSITGQMNAMGSRVYANVTSLFAGREFNNSEHRREVAEILGLEEERIPPRPSLAYDQILDRVESGEIRALWVIATNPVHSWIDSGRWARLREKLEFLVVQDMYPTTETSRIADLYLPAAGWGEKEGTQINSERRIGFTAAVRRPPGQALTDFDIFRLIAAASGNAERFSKWSSPEAAFRLLQALSRGRPCDISGIDGYDQIVREGGVQWPCAPGAPEKGTKRLFEDGIFFTPNGKAKLLFDPPRPVAEPTDEAYPLVLLTGRGSSSQWHTGSRTDKSAVLRNLSPDRLHLEMHPDDAASKGLAAGQTVRVRSRRGSLEASLAISAAVGKGRVFLPMHDGRVNALTFPSYDPHSRQPSYKHCAVAVEAYLANSNR